MFTSDQVKGLEQWVALALHNEVHSKSPRITPVKQVAQNSPDHWVVDVDGDMLMLMILLLMVMDIC